MTTPLERRFGRLLREHRQAAGLGQAEVGDKLDVAQPTVSRWESGKLIPPLDQLVALADLLGFSLDELRAAS